MIYVYQALPMTGRSEEEVFDNIAKQRKQVREMLKDGVTLNNDKHFSVVADNDICFLCNFQYRIKSISPRREPLVYLGRAVMDLMAKCDIIAMDTNWKNSKGCQCEEYIAKIYGIPVLYL